MEIKLTDKKISNYIKGIAAVCIMLGHYTQSFPWYINVLFPGNLYVALFFFYSGYGLNYSFNKNSNYLSGFIAKKLTGVYLPFVAAESVYTIAVCIISQSFNAVDFLLNCSGVVLLNTTLWYVIELIVIYAIFYLQKKFLNNKKSIIIWALCFLSFIILGVLKDIGPWWYISTSAFFMGYYYELFEKVYNYILKNKLFSLMFAAAFFAVYAAGSYFSVTQTNLFGIKYTYFIVLLQLIAAPLFIIFIMIVVQKINTVREIKLLSVLGGISYEIYLWHMFFYMIVCLIIESPVLSLLVSLAATIFASVAFCGIRQKICNKKRRQL